MYVHLKLCHYGIPLDLDPHSAITKLVFIFAQMFWLSLATTTAAFGWFVVWIGNSATVTEAENERPQTS